MATAPDAPPVDPDARIGDSIPRAVRIAGAWSWRILGVVAVLWVAVYLVIALHTVGIPGLVATLLSGLLTPIKNAMTRRGVPKWLALLITFLGTLAVIVGLVVL